MRVFQAHHTVSTTFDWRMRVSAVTRGMPSTMAVDAIKRSDGSLGNGQAYGEGRDLRRRGPENDARHGLTHERLDAAHDYDALVVGQPGDLPQGDGGDCDAGPLPRYEDSFVGALREALGIARHPEQGVGVEQDHWICLIWSPNLRAE